MPSERPSRTARKVALNVVTLGSKRGMERVLPAGVVEATANLLVASGAVSQSAVRFSRSRTAVGLYQAFDWMMPGQFEAFAYRKAFCERRVRESIASGGVQVLVLGAGYDTLAWRLAPEFPGVEFFEIDHPATARRKAKGLATMGQRDNLHVIARDLGAHRLADVLRTEARWDPTAPAAFVAEGLLMYLQPRAVAALFEQCAEASGAGSVMAFSYVGTRADGRPDAGPWTGLVLRLLEAGGEPWLWSMNPEQLANFLEEHHWTLPPDPAPSSDRHGIEFFGLAVRR